MDQTGNQLDLSTITGPIRPFEGITLTGACPCLILELHNSTCSFVATKGNMYFVNHTSHDHIWADNDCCLFEAGLGAIAPDWMTNGQYNGTAELLGQEVDVWWFPSNNDPLKQCFAYWNSRDKLNSPVQFYGLTGVGYTILNYYDFLPGEISKGIDLSLPLKGCDIACKPPMLKKRKIVKKTMNRRTLATLAHL